MNDAEDMYAVANNTVKDKITRMGQFSNVMIANADNGRETLREV